MQGAFIPGLSLAVLYALCAGVTIVRPSGSGPAAEALTLREATAERLSVAAADRRAAAAGYC